MTPTFDAFISGSFSVDGTDQFWNYKPGLDARTDATVVVAHSTAAGCDIEAPAGWTVLEKVTTSGNTYMVSWAPTPVSDGTFTTVGGDYIAGGFIATKGITYHLVSTYGGANVVRVLDVESTSGTSARFPTLAARASVLRQQILSGVPHGIVDLSLATDPGDYLGPGLAISSGVEDFRNVFLTWSSLDPDDVYDIGPVDASSVLFTSQVGGVPQDSYWTGFAVEIAGGVPRLRQRQRDDLRQRQSDSRQLTARQRGYF